MPGQTLSHFSVALFKDELPVAFPSVVLRVQDPFPGGHIHSFGFLPMNTGNMIVNPVAKSPKLAITKIKIW